MPPLVLPLPLISFWGLTVAKCSWNQPPRTTHMASLQGQRERQRRLEMDGVGVITSTEAYAVKIYIQPQV